MHIPFWPFSVSSIHSLEFCCTNCKGCHFNVRSFYHNLTTDFAKSNKYYSHWGNKCFGKDGIASFYKKYVTKHVKCVRLGMNEKIMSSKFWACENNKTHWKLHKTLLLVRTIDTWFCALKESVPLVKVLMLTSCTKFVSRKYAFVCVTPWHALKR